MQDSRVLEYGGIYFSCIHKENIREIFSLKDHALIYLSGGRLEISGVTDSSTVDSPAASLGTSAPPTTSAPSTSSAPSAPSTSPRTTASSASSAPSAPSASPSTTASSASSAPSAPSASPMTTAPSTSFAPSASPMIPSEAQLLRLSPGESIFLRKDHHVSLAKSMAEDGTPYKAVTLTFSRHFLLEFFRNAKNGSGSGAHNRMLSSSLEDGTFADIISTKISRSPSPLLKIPARPDVSALFQSLMPYFWSEEKPDKSWLDMKMTEGLMCILRTDPNVYASLFDFSSPWKLDLKAFMEENFTADFSLADFANYTGRSLSTFNRDFRKIFGETPEKWLIRRRLEYARELIRTEGSKIHDAMNDAGFSNLSHFSRVYKAAFGVAPSKDGREM